MIKYDTIRTQENSFVAQSSSFKGGQDRPAQVIVDNKCTTFCLKAILCLDPAV